MSISVLYDGWPIIRQPLSPAAQHLLTLLTALPEQLQPAVALPSAPPEWFPDVLTYIQITPDSPRDRLNWEGRILPNLAKKAHAEIIHHTHSPAVGFGKSSRVISPTGYNHIFGRERASRISGEVQPWRKPSLSFWVRVREAMSLGGFAQARAIFWPTDLPAQGINGAVVGLPPIVHPGFIIDRGKPEFSNQSELSNLGIPDTYVIYHGPVQQPWIHQLLSGWSWAADAIGDYYFLLVLGLGSSAQDNFHSMLKEYHLDERVKPLANIAPNLLPALYRGSSALFHPAPVSPWGGAIRLALASGVPVVATEQVLSSALVGPAAYLVSPGDARALGAALITVIVEKEIGTRLSQVGLQRAATWDPIKFSEQLVSAYQLVLSGKSSR